VNDPRKDRTKDYKLIDIIVIAICAVICAVICGAEGWVAMGTLWQKQIALAEAIFGTSPWNAFT
jgi:ABC-type thiamin/hydroxymethylpyrimidine transport system permease subunit